MKLWNIITIVMISILSLPVFADIHLSAPSQLKLQVVNGKNATNESPLVLKNGENQIAFRYEVRYRTGSEETFFASDIILMTFEGNDQNYVITLPKLSTKAQREDFNNKPAITLTDSNGKAVAFEQSKLMKNGMQFNRDLVAELAVYNQTSKPASLNQPTSIIIPAGSKSEGDVAGEMLNYWYSKADEKTRAKFKARINK